MQLVSCLAIQVPLFWLLLVFLIFPCNGTAKKATCKDRLRSCKGLRRLCHRYIYWMGKNCPEACGLCEKENPCKLKKCSYYSRCKLVNRVVAKCVCRNLWECPKRRFFVCGSDKITYRNKCTLKSIACRLKLDVKVTSAGFCKFPCAKKKCHVFAKCDASSGVPICKCPSLEDCPRIARPICDKNGVTYYNSCHWRVKSCRAKVKTPIVSRWRCVLSKTIPVGKLKESSGPHNSCRSISCPYYTLCREIDGYPKCVKICPSPVCSCMYGVEYKYNMNGCQACRCRLPSILNTGK